MNSEIRLPAEWEKQSALQLTWPHSEEIWEGDFPEIEKKFVSLSKIMISHTRLIIICLEPNVVIPFFNKDEKKKIDFIKIQSNDIWSRDHGFISTIRKDGLHLLNFIFNGWGLKFASNYDNQINLKLIESYIFSDLVSFQNIPIVFEGGSIDSNGKGIALTTAKCIFSPNRNEHINKKDLVEKIKGIFGLKTLHIIKNGFLSGDDTDSHIDMLARFVNENTIVHATCKNKEDEHYEALNNMKLELKELTNIEGKKYNLLEIPIGRVFYKGKRLPASYINFLLINGAVIVPQYHIEEDKTAIEIFKNIFTERKIIPFDCSIFIRQGGSLHCATMNFFEGTIV